jgi:bacterial/archaeal transporter family protein
MNISLSWWMYALLSAVFAALTTIFAKIGVESIDSNLATAIRTVFILLVAWGIVFAQGQFESLSDIPAKTLLFLGLSGIATGFSYKSGKLLLLRRLINPAWF